MQTLSFRNGDQMPIVGLGTWKSDPGDVYEAVKTALELGYRHIDCAPIYGNEAEVGRAFAEAFDEGIVSRDELWVTSKLWNDAHRPEHVRPALEETLEDLQLDRLDLYLMHWPVALEHGVSMPESGDDLIALDELPLSTTWAAMEELVDAGLTDHIGVSNFSIEKLDDLIADADHAPEMNQIEMHPYLPQNDMLDYCEEAGVHLTAYSPLGSSDRPKAMKGDDEPRLLDDPTIQAVAERRDASPAQVLISWAVHRNTAVIPKSVTPSHIEDNLAAADVALTDEDMEAIGSVERSYRYVGGELWTIEGSPYTLAGLWDE